MKGDELLLRKAASNLYNPTGEPGKDAHALAQLRLACCGSPRAEVNRQRPT